MASGNNIIRIKGVGDGSSSFTVKPECQNSVNACRQVLLKKLPALFEKFIVQLDDALFKLSGKTETHAEQESYFVAMRELRRQRDAIESQFNASLLRGFDSFWRLGPTYKESENLINVFDSEKALLLSDADLEEDLAVDNMVVKGEQNFFRDIYALNERFGFMAHGVKIEVENNPVGPAAIADCFKAVVLGLKFDLQIKLLIFKYFEVGVIENLDLLYDELNELLTRADILPNLTHRIVKRSGDKESLNNSKDTANYNDLFGALQELLSLRRDPGAIVPSDQGEAAVVFSPDDLCDSLTAIQRQAVPKGEKLVNVREMLDQRISTQQGTIGQTELDTIDVISMLFEFILEDKSLPDAMTVLLGRLQIPMLKVAIQDKSFFGKKDHPARKLLNTLARAAVGWSRISGKAEGNLYSRIEEVVERVVNEFDHDMGLFSELNEQFEAFLEDEVRSAEVAEERAAEVARGKEQLAQAKLRVDEEIVHCLGQVDQLPPEVFDLINDAWRDVLTLTLLRKGEESDSWRQAVLLVRRLIWSVQPKIARVESQSLLKAIPDLLKGLRLGLKEISYDQHKMTDLFKTLQGYHLLCLKGEQVTEQLKRAEIKPRLVEKRKEAKAARAALSEKVAKDQHMLQAKTLVVGSWLKVTNDKGKSISAKLSWRSQVTGNCLFVNHKGVKLVELRLERLAQWFREGKAEVIEKSVVPLTDRAMDALLASLKGNGK